MVLQEGDVQSPSSSRRANLTHLDCSLSEIRQLVPGSGSLDSYSVFEQIFKSSSGCSSWKDSVVLVAFSVTPSKTA